MTGPSGDGAVAAVGDPDGTRADGERERIAADAECDRRGDAPDCRIDLDHARRIGVEHPDGTFAGCDRDREWSRRTRPGLERQARLHVAASRVDLEHLRACTAQRPDGAAACGDSVQRCVEIDSTNHTTRSAAGGDLQQPIPAIRHPEITAERSRADAGQRPGTACRCDRRAARRPKRRQPDTCRDAAVARIHGDEPAFAAVEEPQHASGDRQLIGEPPVASCRRTASVAGSRAVRVWLASPQTQINPPATATCEGSPTSRVWPVTRLDVGSITAIESGATRTTA